MKCRVLLFLLVLGGSIFQSHRLWAQPDPVEKAVAGPQLPPDQVKKPVAGPQLLSDPVAGPQLAPVAPVAPVAPAPAASQVSTPQKSAAITEIDWGLLYEYDIIASKPSAKLQAINGKMIKFAGFMIPLDGDPQKGTTEFLFVPGVPSCVHVPPPPVNQTVHVKMRKGRSIPYTFYPIWLYGRFSILKHAKSFGAGLSDGTLAMPALFEIQGERWEEYKF